MSDNSISIEDFNKLIVDLIEAEYELETNDVNIFEILGLQSYEIRHSNFIAWLLDPDETHGLNDLFLQKFLLLVLGRGSNHGIIKADEKFELLLSDLSRATIEREKFLPGIMNDVRKNGYIDILISTDKLLICIENKVESSEGEKQLDSYRTELDKRYSSLKRLYVYLTRDGIEAADDEEKRYWVPIGYGDIKKDILEPIIDTVDMDESVEMLVKQYIQTLGRYVVEDEEIREKCLEIYKNHAEILDIIFANKPDAASDLASAVGAQLEVSGEKLGVVFNPAYCGSKIVRFRTADIMSFPSPLLSEQDEGIWGKGKKNKAKTFWFFEIKFWEDKSKGEIKYELWFTLYDINNVLSARTGGPELISIIKDHGGKSIDNYPQVRLLGPLSINAESFYENVDKEAEQVVKKCFQAMSEKANKNWNAVVKKMKAF